ncbi:MAG: DUF1549 domain-containing protein, partial [Planctomyces sp.]
MLPDPFSIFPLRAVTGSVVRCDFAPVCRLLLVLALFGPLPCAAAQTADPDPVAVLPVTVLIDTAIDQQNTAAGITAAPQADPDTLLRRTTLDLAGRIPTRRERDWFLQLPAETRQQQLVDRLMQLPDFDFHLRNSLDEML